MRVAWAIPVIVSILILGSVGLAHAAQNGIPFMQEEIDFINMQILAILEQLDNLEVSWENIQGKPVVLSDLDCAEDEIAKYDGTDWGCSVAGSSQSIEHSIVIEVATDVTGIEPLEAFEIIDLPISDEPYNIPINFIKIEAEMDAGTAEDFQIIVVCTVGPHCALNVPLLRIDIDNTSDPSSSYRTANHLDFFVDRLIIPPNTGVVSFELIADNFNGGISTFENLKFVVNFPLPEGAMIPIP